MNVECVVLGAGVIGLTCARQWALNNHEVIIIEAADTFGTETSSRNSEVIHAGIYYPKNSLKAKYCVQGKEQLYAYCEERKIPYKNVGKLIVATQDSEIEGLLGIEQKAINNGVHDIKHLSTSEINALEPEIIAKKGLFSPSTGIIDSHAFMLSVLGDAQGRGAMLAVQSKCLKAVKETNGIRLWIESPEGITELVARYVINATGIEAPNVARLFEGYAEPVDKVLPKAYYCKGNYFTLQGASPFKHLIYPMPNSAGLGIHVTLDLAGQARFGPNTEWIESPNYDVNAAYALLFCQSIQEYYPAIKETDLIPGYAGIRPKITSPTEAAADFVIQDAAQHGIEGLINLFGIESPGLTASFPIAEHVYRAGIQSHR